jgi:hypothetical protein
MGHFHHNGRSFMGNIFPIANLLKETNWAKVNRISLILKAHACCGADITVVNYSGDELCKIRKKGTIFVPLDVTGN